MCSIDFNADGIDDIIAPCWYNTYVYFGSTQMDNQPDLVRHHLILQDPVNAGDVNGDGYDDLLLVESILDSVMTDQCILRFFYGGSNADLIPDNEIIIPYYWGTYQSITPMGSLGDINNDGHDDIGCKWWHADGDSLDLAILLGGSFQMVSVVQNISSNIWPTIYGVGDINNDGFHDFMIGYAPDSSPGSDDYPRYRYVYFGGNGLNLNNRIQLMESYEVNQIYPGGNGIGDMNGDGFDDMLVLTDPINYDNYYTIKQGSTILPQSNELPVSYSPGYPNLIYLPVVGLGDFNGDGYSDFVSADSRSYLWQGIAGVWLGRANANGLSDVVVQSPSTSPYHQFGWKVTTGDFNGDGYCDFAISAPTSHFGSPDYPGYVYVYAGNAQLADTTVGNEDEIAAQNNADMWSLLIYPNPVRAGQLSLNYTLKGKIPDDIGTARIVLYNIKGQVVASQVIIPKQLKTGKGTFKLQQLKAGNYLVAIVCDQTRLATTRLTIK